MSPGSALSMLTGPVRGWTLPRSRVRMPSGVRDLAAVPMSRASRHRNCTASPSFTVMAAGMSWLKRLSITFVNPSMVLAPEAPGDHLVVTSGLLRPASHAALPRVGADLQPHRDHAYRPYRRPHGQSQARFAAWWRWRIWRSLKLDPTISVIMVPSPISASWWGGDADGLRDLAEFSLIRIAARRVRLLRKTPVKRLETAPSGTAVPWRNPDNGSFGYLQVTADVTAASFSDRVLAVMLLGTLAMMLSGTFALAAAVPALRQKPARSGVPAQGRDRPLRAADSAHPARERNDLIDRHLPGVTQ